MCVTDMFFSSDQQKIMIVNRYKKSRFQILAGEPGPFLSPHIPTITSSFVKSSSLPGKITTGCCQRGTDNMLCVDNSSRHIQVLDPDGHPLYQCQVPVVDDADNEITQIDSFMNGDFVVSNIEQKCLQCFDSRGKFVKNVDCLGRQAINPYRCGVLKHGPVVVSDYESNRLVFVDTKNNQVIGEIFNMPLQPSVDFVDDQYIYVRDDFKNVYIYDLKTFKMYANFKTKEYLVNMRVYESVLFGINSSEGSFVKYTGYI